MCMVDTKQAKLLIKIGQNIYWVKRGVGGQFPVCLLL